MSAPDPAGPAVPDVGAVEGPEWRRLLERAHRQLERRDGAVAGAVTLDAPSDDERRLVIGLTGAYRPAGVASVRVGMATLDAGVRALTGADLATVCEVLHHRPVRHRASERLSEDSARALLADHLAGSAHRGEPWFDDWRRSLLRDGTLTRLVRAGQHRLVADLVAVLDALPAADVPLPVLAERATGHTKSLSSGPLPALVLSALACRDGVPPPENVEERRALWDSAGVIVDDLASQVLVAGFAGATGSLLAGELAAAARRAHPRRVTLFELTRAPVRLGGRSVWVCENPSVFRSALTALGPALPPLVCTEGQPSSACWRLLRTAATEGSVVRWRNDFDYAGLRMTQAAVTRLGAAPWRMTAADLRRALAASGPGVEELKGPAPGVPSWDPELLAELDAAGAAVMEERLLDLLVADLRAVADG